MHVTRDRVEWDVDQERQAEQAVKLNSTVVLPDDKIVEYERKADHFWDSFYMQHQNRSVCQCCYICVFYYFMIYCIRFI